MINTEQQNKTEQDVKLCLQFSNTVFPNIQYLALTGSRALGLNHKNSDYDIVIISSFVDKLKSERIRFKGNFFDVKTLPAIKLEDAIILDYRSGNPIFLDLLSNCIIIKDQDDFFKRWVAYAKKVLKNGPFSSTVLTIQTLKVQAGNNLKSVKNTQDAPETYILVFNLAKKLIELNLGYHNLWRGNPRKEFQQLAKVDADFNVGLKNAVADYFKSRSPRSIISFAEKNLATMGYISPFNSTSETKNYINQDYLVLKVLDSKRDVFRVYKDVKQHLSQMCKILGNPKNYFLFRPNYRIQGENTNNVLFVVFFQSKATLNDRLEPFIRLLESMKGSTRYYAPLNLDVSLFFNPCFEIPEIRKLLSLMTKEVESCVDFSRNKSTLFAFESCLKFSLCTTTPIDFLKWLVESWISKSYDTGEHSNIQALVGVRERTLENFEQNYGRQKNVFTKIFKGYLKGQRLKEDYLLSILIELKYSNVPKKAKFNLYRFNVPTYLNDDEVKLWILYRSCLDVVLSILLIEEPLKSYFPFVIKRLCETKSINIDIEIENGGKGKFL